MNDKKITDELKMKWNNLWSNPPMPYFKRFLIAIFPCFTLIFTICFFGPLDIFISNSRFFIAEYYVILKPFALLLFISSILFSVIISLAKGKVFNTLINFILSLTICFYIQGNFLNHELEPLNGTTVQWGLKTTEAIINIMIWLLIIALVSVILYLFEKNRKGIIIFFCVLLSGMQGATLISEIITYETNKVKLNGLKGSYYLSGEGEYELSPNKNIIVILLDSFSNLDMKKLVEENPDALEPFKDFVYYDNCNTSYLGTYPGLLHTITGSFIDVNLTYNENFEKIWNSRSDYFKSIQNEGYDIRAYASSSHLAGDDLSRINNIFSNLKTYRIKKVHSDVLKKFIELSLYRYAPLSMKAIFWIYSDDIYFEAEDIEPMELDYSFIYGIRNHGLSVSNNQKNLLSYYLLSGAHPPFNVDMYGNFSEQETNSYHQAAGYLKSLSEYIEEMKRLNVYDDAIIVITADHGSYDDCPQCIYMIKTPSATHDKIEYNHAPISQSQEAATLLYLLGLPHESYGPTIYDIDENEVIERAIYCWDKDDNYPYVDGQYNVLRKVYYTGDADTITQKLHGETYAEENTDEVYSLVDSFY